MKIPSHLLYICNGTFTATKNTKMYFRFLASVTCQTMKYKIGTFSYK